MNGIKVKVEDIKGKLRDSAHETSNITEESLGNIGLDVKLRGYQLEGVKWLIDVYNAGIGCILADEMGLGKTCQTISFLVYICNKCKQKKKSLIIAPLSVLSNWESELIRFAPKLKFIKYMGSKEERPELQDSITQRNDLDIVLTTYELCMKDSEFLEGFSWNVLIVDEAHRLKNRESLMHQTLLRYDIDHRVLLTGTPLQNNLNELYSLLCFIARPVFKQRFLDDFLEYFSDVTNENSGLAEELTDLLKPFMLRRVKFEVLKDLPKKSELILYHGMSALQKKYYKAILNKDIGAFDVEGKANRTRLSNVLMQLRKCVAHPYLFDGVEPEPFELGEHLIEASGKLIIVDQVLSHLKQTGHKVLIFSQMTRLLDIVQDYLSYRGYTYERLDGSVRAEERFLAVNKFNDDSDTFVFLLSTKAGGQGLNLTSADTILFLDSDFNPQNDLQAAARAHRIGQQRNVKVIRLVGRSTVEEIILKRAENKLKLTSAVMTSAQSSNQPTVEFKLEDILKFGLDELFKNDESTVEDLDLTKVLGHSVEGRWQVTDTTTEPQAGPSTGQNDGEATDNGSTQSMYVFEGTDYSKDRDDADDKVLQQMIDAHKALSMNVAEAGRSLRKHEGVKLMPGEGLLPELPKSRKPRKQLSPEELEQRRIKRAEAAALREKQEEEREVKRAQERKKKQEELWRKHSYDSCSVEIIESEEESDESSTVDEYEGDTEDESSDLIGQSSANQQKKNVIQYVIGDVTHPSCAGNSDAIIIHCVDNSGWWGTGGLFTSISNRSRVPEQQYIKAGKLRDLALGDLHVIPVDDIQSRQTGKDFVGLIVAQTRDNDNRLSGIKLSALQTAFEKLCYIAKKKKASVHLPRLGYKTPGFNWYGTERLIQKCLATRGVPTYVYYFSRNTSQKRKKTSDNSSASAAEGSSSGKNNKRKTNVINDSDEECASVSKSNDDSEDGLSDIFNNVSVYFLNVPADAVKQASRYIIAYDGDVHSKLKSDTTHVIVTDLNSLSQEKRDEVMRTNNAAKIVHIDWILDSARLKKKQNESKYCTSS